MVGHRFSLGENLGMYCYIIAKVLAQLFFAKNRLLIQPIYASHLIFS
jgi:hypothetical protein